MSPDLPYRISREAALSSAANLKSVRDESERALQKLLNTERKLELLTIPARTDDIAQAKPIAARLADHSSLIVVLGIGGSSLGGQALKDLAPPKGSRPELIFVDSPDPVGFERLLTSADLKTTRFIAISKSGGTPETLTQTLVAADALKRAGGGNYLDRHFAVITEPKESPLAQFAHEIKCPRLDHPLGIGGRYSVLSTVGMLPALIMGLDPEAIRAGAGDVVKRAASSGSPCALFAADQAALMRAQAIHESVLWCYSERLRTFGGWWRQLWGESLGKNGKGTTPVSVLGPVDQHSQLQLFLDGPGGAFFTFIDCATAGQGPVVPEADARRLNLNYLAGRRLGDVVDAEARATAETLAQKGRLVRGLTVPSLNERALGALFMHFMLETILVGMLLGVDPFDQPAVESGKVLARKYLEGSR